MRRMGRALRHTSALSGAIGPSVPGLAVSQNRGPLALSRPLLVFKCAVLLARVRQALESVADADAGDEAQVVEIETAGGSAYSIHRGR